MRGMHWRTLGVIGLLGLAAACGDDAAAAPKDAAVDKETDSGPDLIPHRDAAVSGQAALPFCDRFDPTSCGPGEVCDEVIEVVPATDLAESATQIYTGCVKFDGEIREGEHKRIVADEVWNRVQEQLNRNGRRGGRSRTALRGRCRAGVSP